MAPMTRNRAGRDGVVPPMMAAHYRDRAGAGLIITESIPVSPQAIGSRSRRGSTPARRPRAGCASPTPFTDSGPQAHFGYFLGQLRPRGLAYVHVIEGDMMTRSAGAVDYHALKSQFGGTYIANNGYDLHRAMKAVSAGSADLVSSGAPFLANPDLVRRYREDLPLNVPDPSTFYTGGEAGYNDYPRYADGEAAA